MTRAGGPEHRTRTLLRGLRSSGLCVIYHDATLAVRLVENRPESWPPAELILAGGDGAVFDPFTAERVMAVKREVLLKGAPQRIEAPRRRAGEDLLWFELNVEPDADPAGGPPLGVFVSVTDITEVKRREAALRALLFEVSHRSRNLLAILQSILGQTADPASSVPDFVAKFRGRIGALARSQDLITFANWQPVRFRRLAEAQVAPYAGPSEAALRLEGADPLLSPNTTLNLGLALHELAANSAAFGAFGTGAGHVVLRAETAADGVRVEWIEDGARPAEPISGGGFGRTVLEHVAPRALRAVAQYEVGPTSVRYAIHLPEPAEDRPAALADPDAPRPQA